MLERETELELATFCFGSEGLAVGPGCLQPHEDRHVSAWAPPAELVEDGDHASQAFAIRLRHPGDGGDD
jgi:hypothetical protein